MRSSAEATRAGGRVSLLPLTVAVDLIVQLRPHSCTEQLNCVCLLQDTL